MGSVNSDVPAEVARLFGEVARSAQRSGAFAVVTTEAAGVSCRDPIQPEACFRIEADGTRLFVAWASPDRYLSQSIEAELSWTGDDLDELIDEEVQARGWAGAPLGRVEHFRSEQRQFTFRSLIPHSAEAPIRKETAEALFECLLAYQAAFRHLGDMKGGDEIGQ